MKNLFEIFKKIDKNEIIRDYCISSLFENGSELTILRIIAVLTRKRDDLKKLIQEGKENKHSFIRYDGMGLGIPTWEIILENYCAMLKITLGFYEKCVQKM